VRLLKRSGYTLTPLAGNEDTILANDLPKEDTVG
jgi:hypothetical protein